MRSANSMALLLALSLVAVPLYAASSDEAPAEQQAIEALEAKADHAQPRDQCFLYAEVMHRMTELSLSQYASGNVAKATSLLKQIQQLSHKIHLSVSDNDKRLKHAEILLSRTAFRLTELLHSSDFQDRPLIKQTIAEVNQAQNAAMMQVFSK
jgi:hypothetical protein